MTKVPSNFDINLGKKLKTFRNKMNWPLKVVASSVGISLQQMQRYEEGKNKISACLLLELAKLYQAPITCFYDDGKSLVNETTSFEILLVEDNIQDEFIFRKSLEDFPSKLNITSINDGNKALDYFKNINNNGLAQVAKPDLVVLDINLPDMNGLLLLKELKRKPLLRDTPVIIMSNSTDNKVVESSYNLHASGFIRKSFSYEEFKSSCVKILDYWVNAVKLPTT